MNATGDVHTVTAYAVCAHVPDRQVVTAAVTVQPGQGWDTVASCPAGTVNTGGGWFHGSASAVRVGASRPVGQGQGWQVEAENQLNVAYGVTAYAVCVTGS